MKRVKNAPKGNLKVHKTSNGQERQGYTFTSNEPTRKWLLWAVKLG